MANETVQFERGAMGAIFALMKDGKKHTRKQIESVAKKAGADPKYAIMTLQRMSRAGRLARQFAINLVSNESWDTGEYQLSRIGKSAKPAAASSKSAKTVAASSKSAKTVAASSKSAKLAAASSKSAKTASSKSAKTASSKSAKTASSKSAKSAKTVAV